MKFERSESLPAGGSEKSETEKAYEKLKAETAAEALELRKMGFEVDDECRINPEAFAPLYSVINRARNDKAVADLERKFKPIGKEKVERGEILEMAKTLGFNKHWFGKRLLALRTAKYDDYVNGVDNLIIDKETFEPLAAVDTTTAYLTKAKQLAERIQNGSQIKYGYGLDKKGIKKTTYRNLPLFIISFSPDELDKLSENYEDFEDYLLKSLKQQSQDFPEFSKMDREVKDAYIRTRVIFEEVEEDLKAQA